MDELKIDVRTNGMMRKDLLVKSILRAEEAADLLKEFIKRATSEGAKDSEIAALPGVIEGLMKLSDYSRSVAVVEGLEMLSRY